MSFTTIGAKNSRRVKFWEEALAKKEQKHTFINYDDVLAQKPLELNGSLSVRITSPGEDFELYKKILALGDFPNAENLVLDKGLILPNSNWHVGWKKLLNTIETRCDESVRIMNAPTSIALAFDKLQSQKLLQLRKVKTPKIYLESVQSYDHLMDFLKSEKIHQIFIKPYHGSSASGIMALRISSQKQMLYTTIAKSGKKLYNHLKLQKYQSTYEIRDIINAMVPAGLMAEEWIRKKMFNNKSVDLRILIINKQASLVVPRISHHIITNLHLGNEKGNIEDLRNSWGDEVIDTAKREAIKAVEEIGGLFYAGVDVAIDPRGMPVILEVNAFGDMLLGIENNGLNSYDLELQEWLNQ